MGHHSHRHQHLANSLEKTQPIVDFPVAIVPANAIANLVGVDLAGGVLSLCSVFALLIRAGQERTRQSGRVNETIDTSLTEQVLKRYNLSLPDTCIIIQHIIGATMGVH